MISQVGARPDVVTWMLNGTDWARQRAECTRRQVGAIIFKDNRVLAQGFNGALPGELSCLDGGCPRAFSNVAPGSQYEHGPGACIAIHAELNAVLDAARRGIAIGGARMVISTEPCTTCQRLCWSAGLDELLWHTDDFGVASIKTPIKRS